MFKRTGYSQTALYIAMVMAIGFLTFYALPDGIPFLVRLTMMVATQVAVARTVQKGTECERTVVSGG